MILADPPLTPDPDQARQWLVDELSKPQYAEAKPSWFDELSRRVFDWFGSLGAQNGDAPAGWLSLAGIVLVAGIVVLVVLRYGRPSLVRRRAALPETIADASRAPAQIREAAERAAAAGELALAVVERFRAIAAALDERTVVRLLPGTTARELAVEASTAFPQLAARIDEASALFDAVRYGGLAPEAPDYERMARLDADLDAARPQLTPA